MLLGEAFKLRAIENSLNFCHCLHPDWKYTLSLSLVCPLLFSSVPFPGISFLTFTFMHLGKKKGKGKGEREVVCGQVWWPILGICPLHLTHPSAHSQQWTHTRSSGQPCCGARGAVGGSVPCSRVSPQSWYWRWREHLLFTPPTDNPCRTWESNLQPLGYKSNSLTIRPWLPQNLADTFIQSNLHCIQVTVFTFYQLLLSLGNIPWIFLIQTCWNVLGRRGGIRG